MATLKERINSFSERILNNALVIPQIQRWCNRHSTEGYGLRFVPHPGSVVNDVFSSYRFFDVQQNDIVLDLGANVGTFSMFMASMTSHVYAVEPMMTEILRQNIRLNNICNITVLEKALGSGTLNLTWQNCNNKIIQGNTLTELIEMCGGHIDFLKVDTEGTEWIIQSHELDNIRRIEMEVHIINTSHDIKDYYSILSEAEYEFTCDSQYLDIYLIHAWRKYMDINV